MSDDRPKSGCDWIIIIAIGVALGIWLNHACATVKLVEKQDSAITVQEGKR